MKKLTFGAEWSPLRVEYAFSALEVIVGIPGRRVDLHLNVLTQIKDNRLQLLIHDDDEPDWYHVEERLSGFATSCDLRINVVVPRAQASLVEPAHDLFKTKIPRMFAQDRVVVAPRHTNYLPRD